MTSGVEPTACNPTNSCHPFAEVKSAADIFIDRLKFPLDRVSIIQFDINASAPDEVGSGSFANQSVWFNSASDAKAVVNGMTVFNDGDNSDTPDNTPPTSDDDKKNPAPTLSTNIGGALRLGGNQFNYERRRDAVWVVVLLTDGAANVTDAPLIDETGNILLKHGYCPDKPKDPLDPGDDPADFNYWDNFDIPPCADPDPISRHSIKSGGKHNAHNVYDPYAKDAFDFNQYLYDADDYAHDMAD